MYTKKILSMAATIALVSTASLAFETNTQGQILADDMVSETYTGGTPATSDLNLSDGLYGDALIYPYFKATDGWTTEIVVRNTTPWATVAKVSVYEKGASADIGDFNVYLSPYDVLRFTLKEGKVFTADGSVPTTVRNPKHGVDADDATWLNLDGNSEELEILKLKAKNKSQLEGYVVVYGMTQYNDGEDTAENTSYGQVTVNLNYHRKHNELFKDYRRLMDDCRPNWRAAFNQNGMKEGVFISRVEGGIPAPDTNIGSECVTTSKGVLGYDLKNFGDVASNTLTGTVRVLKEDGQQSRDLLLPATAISNFSENNMYLWAEGEFAGLEDRRLERKEGVVTQEQVDAKEDGVKLPAGTKRVGDTYAYYYDAETVKKDSNTFMTKTALYTFDSKEGAAVTNQILVTQPTKRILGQLFGTPGDGSNGYYWIKDKTDYGGFTLEYFLLDEDEGADIEEIGFTRITSPAGNIGETPTFPDEMQKITSAELEELAEGEEFRNNDGYSFLNFIGSTEPVEGIPAIVTEMTGTKVGGIAQTNWIYAPTTK